MSDTRKGTIESVSERVSKRGSEYGNKSANLMELVDVSNTVKNNLINVAVPEIFPLSDKFIKDYLDNNCKLYKSSWIQLMGSEQSWHVLWDKFVSEQGKRSELTQNAKKILEELRNLIKTTFIEHPIENVIENINLPADTLFMVRSTGEEDTVEVANPGGNKSVAAVKLDAASMSKAISTVVASYLSEKSLTQRLLSGDDISKPTFMPVLIQRMIGEQLNNKDRNGIVVSGVMYANRNSVSIDVAPGHGELIVNSKASFDTYEMNVSTGIVHPQINAKDQRLVPVETDELNEAGSKKRKLVFQDNPLETRHLPSLSQAVAKAIMEVGKEISSHYDMPMDIEFVYQPELKTLYLVQARPIPQYKKAKIEPSAIAPDYWAELQRDGATKQMKCNVPGSGGNAAKVITGVDGVIAKKKIGNALKRYLSDSRLQKSVKAVVVEENAPASSHEVAFFNSQGIPVLQIDGPLKKFKSMVKSSKAVVVDPQRKVIVDLADREGVLYGGESELKKRKILADGLFVSSASTNKSLLEVDYEINDEMKRILSEYLSLNEAVNTKTAYTQLLECIRKLESVKAGDKNAEAYAALKKAAVLFKKIGTSTRAQEKDAPHKLLMQHAMLSIAEMHLLLDGYSNPTSDKYSDTEKLQLLLDATAKFKGLVDGTGSNVLYAASVKQIAEINKLTNGKNITTTGKQREYLQEFLKLGLMAFEPSVRDKWNEFALDCSKSSYRRSVLAGIIASASKHNLQSDLINEIFADNSTSDHKRKLRQMFDVVTEYIDAVKKFNYDDNQRIIDKWTAKIPEWSEPGNFNKLFDEYTADINELNKNLKLNSGLSKYAMRAQIEQVRMQTDMMDKTIKSLKGSPLYSSDVKLQVVRFSMLLDPYHELMARWMGEIPAHKYDKWEEKVRKNYSRYTKSKMIDYISDTYKSTAANAKRAYSSNEASNHLHPSGSLSVSSAKIGSSCSFKRHFVRQSKSGRLTLEDLFSLMHQNILSSTLVVEEVKGIKSNKVPAALSSLKTAIDNLGSTQLFGVRQDYPLVTMEYNIPLQNHSVKLTVRYNMQSKTFEIEWGMFGKNWSDRMTQLENLLYWDGVLLGADMPNRPRYNETQRDLTVFWNIKSIDVDALAKNITSCIFEYTKAMNDNHVSGGGSDRNAFAHAFDRFKELSIDQQAKCLNSQSKKNMERIFELLNDISRSDMESYLRRCPSLYLVFIDNANKLDSGLIDKILQASINKELLTKLIAKLGLFYPVKGSNDSTLFDKMLQVYSSTEICEFLRINKIDFRNQLDALNQVFSKSKPDIDLARQMFALGAPLTRITGKTLSVILEIGDADMIAALEKQIATMNADQFTDLIIDAIHIVNKTVVSKLQQLIVDNKNKLNWSKDLPESIALMLNESKQDMAFLTGLLNDVKISFKDHRTILYKSLLDGYDDLVNQLLMNGSDIDEVENILFEPKIFENEKTKNALFSILRKFSDKKFNDVLNYNLGRLPDRYAQVKEVMEKFAEKVGYSDAEQLRGCLSKLDPADFMPMFEKQQLDLSNVEYKRLYSAALANPKCDAKVLDLLHKFGVPANSQEDAISKLVDLHIQSSDLTYLSRLRDIFLSDPDNVVSYSKLIHRMVRNDSLMSPRLLGLIKGTVKHLDLTNYNSGSSVLEELYGNVVNAGHLPDYLTAILGKGAIDCSKSPTYLAQLIGRSQYALARYVIANAKNIDACMNIDFSRLGSDEGEGRLVLMKLLKKLSPRKFNSVLGDQLNRKKIPFTMEMLIRFSDKVDLSESELLDALLANGEGAYVSYLIAGKKPNLSGNEKAFGIAFRKHGQDQFHSDLLLSLYSSGAAIEHDYDTFKKLYAIAIEENSAELMKIFEDEAKKLNAEEFSKLFMQLINTSRYKDNFSRLFDLMVVNKDKVQFNLRFNSTMTFLEIAVLTSKLFNDGDNKLMALLVDANDAKIDHNEMPDLFMKSMLTASYQLARIVIEKGENIDSARLLMLKDVDMSNPDAKQIFETYLDKLSSAKITELFSRNISDIESNHDSYLELIKKYSSKIDFCRSNWVRGSLIRDIISKIKDKKQLLDFLSEVKPNLAGVNVSEIYGEILQQQEYKGLDLDFTKVLLECGARYEQVSLCWLLEARRWLKVDELFEQYFTTNNIQNGWTNYLYKTVLQTVNPQQLLDFINSHLNQLQFDYSESGSSTLLEVLLLALMRSTEPKDVAKIIAILPKQIDLDKHKQLLTYYYRGAEWPELLKAIIEKSINLNDMTQLPRDALLLSPDYKDVLSILKEKLPTVNWDQKQAVAEASVINDDGDKKFMGSSYTLNELKRSFLITFSDKGLMSEHLNDFHITYTDKWHPGAFMAAMRTLINEHNVNPEDAVKQINGMEFWQAFCLERCYKNGLRNIHLQHLRPASGDELSWQHRDMLDWLINEKHCDPGAAVAVVTGVKRNDLCLRYPKETEQQIKDKFYQGCMDYQNSMKAPGMFSSDLLDMLEKDGWQKTENVLFKSGIKGEYTVDDVIASAKYCWGVPKYLVEQKPDLKAKFTAQNIIDLIGAGRMGLHAVSAIFDNKLPDLKISQQQFDMLTDNLKRVAVPGNYDQYVLGKVTIIQPNLSSNPNSMFGSKNANADNQAGMKPFTTIPDPTFL